MKEINKLRNKIEIIDSKMKKLFIKRMNASKEMKAIKDKYSLPYKDNKREEDMLNKYTSDISEFKDEYIEFLNDILKISKDVMNKK